MTSRIKLTRFRIQNFQCVDDSGWIEIEDLTTLLGKNELWKNNGQGPIPFVILGNKIDLKNTGIECITDQTLQKIMRK